jgi:hypothetical protein
MALFGLFGNDQSMARSTYAGRESASDRRARRQEEREADQRAARVRGHRRAANRVDRQVAAAEDTNRRADNAPGRRGRGWW